ncbi:MAG: MotA/TolQ/ExbB proton channel family protein [Epulopiscium sp.]|nr:MotA/TolQ/ExbB proton channel family protein [Candidatus Epulonipiscium sp.]
MNLLTIIAKNLLGYDALILVLAAFNLLYVFPKVSKISRQLEEVLNPTISIPIQELIKNIQDPGTKAVDLHACQKWKEKEAFYFNVFVGITTIFPLLGILGTIISLLSLVDFSSQVVMLNFTTALTSTFWGLIWAIVCKSLEGFIASRVAYNEESFSLLLQRIDQYQSFHSSTKP